jgi:hypothetical protein
MEQLSLHPWPEFYDTRTNNVVITTSNENLNGKLYKKILLLEGIALQNIVSHTHCHTNGVMVLQRLVQTYKPLVPHRL